MTFSTTTTAPSTSMPSAMARPPRLIRLADMPNFCIMMKVMSTASGRVKRDHQCGTQVAEEQHQQDDDQHDGLGKRLGDGADGTFHQAAAIVEHLGGHALRQRGREFGEFLAHAVHHFLGVGAAQAQHQAFHCFALAVHGDDAITGQAADAHLRDIADTDRVVAGTGDDDVAHVLQGLDAAFRAHQQRFVAVAEASGAVVAVVRFQRLLQLLHGKSARSEGRVIGHDFEAARQAAERVDVGHAGQGAQGGAYGPVQNGAALFQRDAFAFHGEHEHLAQRGGDRCEAAAGAAGQVAHRVAQPFGDLLARPVDIGAVVEIDGDVGDGIFGDGAQHALVGDAQHLQLDRRDDARFDLFRRHAGRLHDDLHLRGRDIGEGVDGQLAERDDARADQQQREHGDQQALGQREFDQSGQHHSPPMPIRLALSPETPRTAIFSPPLSLPVTTLSVAPSCSTVTSSLR